MNVILWILAILSLAGGIYLGTEESDIWYIYGIVSFVVFGGFASIVSLLKEISTKLSDMNGELTRLRSEKNENHRENSSAPADTGRTVYEGQAWPNEQDKKDTGSDSAPAVLPSESNLYSAGDRVTYNGVDGARTGTVSDVQTLYGGGCFRYKIVFDDTGITDNLWYAQSDLTRAQQPDPEAGKAAVVPAVGTVKKPEKAEQTKRCSRCGTILTGKVSFCPECGSKVEKPDEKQAPDDSAPTGKTEQEKEEKPKNAPVAFSFENEERIIELMSKYGELFNKGILTEEEFKKKKAILLSQADDAVPSGQQADRTALPFEETAASSAEDTSAEEEPAPAKNPLQPKPAENIHPAVTPAQEKPASVCRETDEKSRFGVNPLGKKAVYPSETADGKAECPFCGTKQNRGRHVCQKCGVPFMYEETTSL